MSLNNLSDLDISDFNSDDLILINSLYQGKEDDYSFFRKSEWSIIQEMYNKMKMNDIRNNLITIKHTYKNKFRTSPFLFWLSKDIDKKFGEMEPLTKYNKNEIIIKLINNNFNNNHKTNIGCLRKELRDKWTEFIFYYTLSK